MTIFIIILLSSTYLVSAEESETQKIIINAGLTIIVPDDYLTIQEAIDNAGSDDCIYVKNGTYTVAITITQDNLTIQGEDKNNTIIQGDGSANIINIQGDFININGFTIEQSHGFSGIFIANSSNNEIIGNILKYCNGDGIGLYSAHNNTIQNNIISNCDEIGIDLDYSNNNSIKGNILMNSTWIGMALLNSNENNIDNNIIEDSRNYGIDMVSSDKNILSKNTIQRSLLNGLMIWKCNNNSFLSNKIQYNFEDGMWIYYSDNNTIQSNFFIENRWNGIDIVYSDCNLIKENIFYQCPDNAIGSYYSAQNRILNNTFLENGIGIYLYDSVSNEVCYNNFIESCSSYGHAIFYNSLETVWYENYWDDWIGVRIKIIGKSRILRKIPKCIRGEIKRNRNLKPVRWYNFDWSPACEPYEYDFSIYPEVLNNE